MERWCCNIEHSNATNPRTNPESDVPLRESPQGFSDTYRYIQNSMLSYTGHSGQCDMTYSELPSWFPLELSEGDKVIFTACGESKIYDKNNLGLLGWAIHLKPQKLSYLNSQLVEVVVFVFFVIFFIVYMWVGLCVTSMFECVCIMWLCVGAFVLVWNDWCI